MGVVDLFHCIFGGLNSRVCGCLVEFAGGLLCIVVSFVGAG